MENKKYYLIKYVSEDGHEFVLQRNGRVFVWNNYGKNKEYKQLIAARRAAIRIRGTSKFKNDSGKVVVVGVTFSPCNPLIPDGFYKPVETVVASF